MSASSLHHKQRIRPDYCRSGPEGRNCTHPIAFRTSPNIASLNLTRAATLSLTDDLATEAGREDLAAVGAALEGRGKDAGRKDGEAGEGGELHLG